MAGTTTDSDERLVTLAGEGDLDALGALLDRHLHPAWRVALAGSPSAEAAEAAVVTGFCDALNAAGRHPESTVSLRTRLAGAVHRACVAADRADRGAHRAVAEAPEDPALAAFLALPVASRIALWLTEVEGGAPEQVAPVLGLDRSATGALADRAAVALRGRLATEAAARAIDPECRIALGKLPAHAAGKLTSAERGRIGEHLAGCGSCASWLAAIVAPRPALRRLVVPVPASLPTAVAEAWAERGGRDRSPLLRAWSERAVGAAAAAVLAVGLAGAVFGGRSDDDEEGPELASPAGSLDLSEVGADDDPPAPVTPAAPVVAETAVLSSGLSAAPAGPTATDADRPRTADTPATPPAAPPTTTPPTTPPTTTPPTTAPPAEEPPIAVEEGPTIDLGVVEVELDESPQVEVEVPGLPPVSLP